MSDTKLGLSRNQVSVRKNAGMNTFLNQIKLQKYAEKPKTSIGKGSVGMTLTEKKPDIITELVPVVALNQMKRKYKVYRTLNQVETKEKQVKPFETDDKKYVIKRGKEVDIYNPSRTNKITIKQTRAPIASKFSKRLELDHIEQMIEGMATVPDFGFDTTPFIKNNSHQGWGILRDFFQRQHKYERVENYL